MGSPYVPLVLKSVHKYGQGGSAQTYIQKYYAVYYIHTLVESYQPYAIHRTLHRSVHISHLIERILMDFFLGTPFDLDISSSSRGLYKHTYNLTWTVKTYVSLDTTEISYRKTVSYYIYFNYLESSWIPIGIQLMYLEFLKIRQIYFSQLLQLAK